MTYHDPTNYEGGNKGDPGDPYVCPRCNESGSWKVDYPEAAWQDVEVVYDEDGNAAIADHGVGGYGHYDDGDGEDERLVCRECGWSITLGEHVFVEHRSSAETKDCPSDDGFYREINVSQYGKHVFATTARSIRSENQGKDLVKLLRERFPSNEGYEVRLTNWRLTSDPFALTKAEMTE